jgi:hypothetical protein
MNSIRLAVDTIGQDLKRFSSGAMAEAESRDIEGGNSKANNSALRDLQRNPFYPALAGSVKPGRQIEDFGATAVRRELWRLQVMVRSAYCILFSTGGNSQTLNSSHGRLQRKPFHPEHSGSVKPGRQIADLALQPFARKRSVLKWWRNSHVRSSFQKSANQS